MAHEDLIFRYACKEPLDEKEKEIINSQLAFNIDNLKKLEEVKLVYDIVDNLTNDDKRSNYNSYSANRIFNNTNRKKSVVLANKILIHLVADNEPLNIIGKKTLKYNLKFNKLFTCELQKYSRFNKNIGNVLTDTETFDLHAKLDTLHDEFFGDRHKTEKVPDDYVSTIRARYKKQLELVETVEQQHITLENTKPAVENNNVIEERTQPEKKLEVVNTEELPGRSFKIGKWKTVAASITLLIGLSASFYFGHSKTSPESIYNKYHETYIAGKFDRYAPDVLLNSAMYQYHSENYKEAKRIFIELQGKRKYKKTARFYLGLTNMELNLFDEAIMDFTDKSLIESKYKFSSQWYLALCLVKTNDIKMAKYFLNQLTLTKNTYYDKAKELLKNLD